MSGQWEVVGKSKKDKQSGKTKKMSKNEKQKFVENAPKVEDLLPLAQVKTLYASLDTNKEPPKPVEKAIKIKETETKKIQKKPKEKKEPLKENKPPKTIEAAVALITASDVQNVLEVGQLRFSEAPLVWLKGLASWLNTKLPVDHTDNAFTAKSWEYPLCLLSSDTRAVFKKAFKEVPESAIQMFYDYCLTSMANDMTKGSPVTGYKMLLQMVASQSPNVAVSNLSKCAALRHSYQNRPSIGCSIMWALGQTGFKDLSVGLQVWQAVMFPVCELRHYTQFVNDYLKYLLARHSTSKALTLQQYLDILDTIGTRPSPQLLTYLQSLQEILCNVNTESHLNSLFQPLLSRLNQSSPSSLKNQILKLLVDCLAGDTQCQTVWRQLYTREIPQSAVLLKHISAEWSLLRDRLSAKQMKVTLKAFQATNADMIKHKQKAEGLQDCTRVVDALLKKLSDRKSFPWKTLSLVIAVAIAAVVVFDINTQGSFKASKTGTFLKNIGALSYAEQAWLRGKELSIQGYRWGQSHVPEYVEEVKELLKPYLALLVDWGTKLTLQVAAGVDTVIQYCVERKPVVEQWVNQYAPGMMEVVSFWLSRLGQILLEFTTVVLKYLSITLCWLRENVFVGRLSPENLQRVTLEALNTTQTLASQTFSWLNSKVITTDSKSV